MKTIRLKRDGVTVRVSVAPSTLIVDAQCGWFAEPMTEYREHGGALAGVDRPEQTPLAKALIAAAVDRAMRRPARSAFDRLCDELHAERQARQCAGKPLRMALAPRRSRAARRIIFFKGV
ncbi:hypothetical protein [Paraburkholderia solisilvae]|uniref:Uncharacterized protein n=1 Tax=Paraburkholderia solisilvae TaxID=624376 RepID=A0A6J5DGI9_9BURK|nr:hypothetical protein [Paraburkholderia solisilvae]CAB3753003.1 hypothetical protein LMG29739_01640 [Paraburkholderia solisilvae]